VLDSARFPGLPRMGRDAYAPAMSLVVSAEPDERVRIRFDPSLAALKPLLIMATVMAIGFALFTLLKGGPLWSAAMAFFPMLFLLGFLRLLKRRHVQPVEFMLDAKERKLTGPEVDYTFPHVGYLVLDSYTAHQRGSTTMSQGARDATIFRLSFVGKEANAEELAERVREIEARPEYFEKGAPAAPGDGDVLMPRGPYALGRALAREGGLGLNLPLMDLSSKPPRLFDVDEQATTLEGLLATRGGMGDPGPAPRGVHRRDRPGEIRLGHAASSLPLRLFGVVASIGSALMFYLCSGGALYIGIWPLFLMLLLMGATRWIITPEGVTTSSTWLGIAVSNKFFSYDELEDISAASERDRHYVRLTANGETQRVIVPRLEMANYLAACALNPPEREREPTSPYR